MKKTAVFSVMLSGLLFMSVTADAQYKETLEKAKSSETPVVITLEQALEIALSENVSVKVADLEIKRAHLSF